MDNKMRESFFATTHKTLAENLREDFLLIWLDPTCGKNKDNEHTEKQLRTIDSSLQVHSTIEQSLHCIREINPQNVFIIISGSYGESVINQIDPISTVVLVYVFCHEKSKHEQWAKNYNKIGKRIFDKKDSLFHQLEEDIQRCIRDILPISILRSNVNQKSFRDLKEDGALFIWFQLLIKNLIDLPPTEIALKELMDICQGQYRDRENKLIKEFKGAYCKADATKWYSRDSFLYRQLNKALRTENFDVIYKFRLFIADFHKQILQLGIGNLKAKADKNQILTVYRGQYISQDELDYIKNSQNGYIAMNTFLSTSLSSVIALGFQGNDNNQPLSLKFALFEIMINFETLRSSAVPFALISDLSEMKEEEEVVFSIGAVFRIAAVDEDTYPFCHIEMTFDSKQSTELMDLFNFYAGKAHLAPTSLLDLSDIFLLIDDYDRAERYNRILLEQISEIHLDVPKIYTNLANIYRLRGSFDEAERYLNLANNSQWKNTISKVTLCDICISRGLLDDKKGNYQAAQRKLFEANGLIETQCVKTAQILKYVGLTYQHQGNYQSSLFYYDQALKIQQNLLPTQHPALADTYTHLASIFTAQFEFGRAMEMHEEVLSIEKKILPRVHSAIAHTYNNIAMIYYNQNNLDAALCNYNTAMKILEEIYGNDYRDLGMLFTNIDVFSKKMDNMNAISYYQKAFEIHQQYFPLSRIDLVLTYNSIGNLRRNQHQFGEVVWYYEKALEILSSPEYINEYQKKTRIYHDYGQYYHVIKDYQQANNYYEKSLKELEFLYGDNTCQPSIVMEHITLGDTYKNAGDFQNSMAHYVKAFRLLTKLEEKTSNQNQRSFRSVGHMAYAQKCYHNAFIWYKKSVNFDSPLYYPYKKYIDEIYAGIEDIRIEYCNPRARYPNTNLGTDMKISGTSGVRV